MLRKILFAVLLVALLFTLSGCKWMLTTMMWGIIGSSDDTASKEDTISFVKEHQNELLSRIEQGECSTLEGYGIIKSVYETDDFVEFYCGGSGFGSQTNYSGFFYAKNGYMNAVRSDISLDTMVEKDGGYYWHDEVGDNTYFVVHICDRFYYYYEHY